MKRVTVAAKVVERMTPRRYLVVEGQRYLVRVLDGIEGYVTRWTQACTGCTEFSEYGLPHGHAFDLKAGCHVGSGCDECGYRGKVRHEWFVPFDEHGVPVRLKP